MKKNLDRSGRILRFVVAIVLFTASIYLQSFTLLFIAAFTLFEALFSWCILYHFLKINKCNIKK